MNTISFITANFVAREAGFALTEGWHQGNNATNDYFRPIDTFPKRFEALLKEIKQLGFQAIDLWIAHLHWAWATREHTKIANSLIAKHRLQIASLAGNFGATRMEFEAACKLANTMELRLLVGGASYFYYNRQAAIEILRKHRLELAIVNHQETSAEKLLEKVGTDNHDVIGVAIDTGWYATLGNELFLAIEKLAPNLKMVQLKNLVNENSKETAAYDDGVVPLQSCVEKLIEIRYNGPVAIEHHPFDRNPTGECQMSLEMLTRWLSP